MIMRALVLFYLIASCVSPAPTITAQATQGCSACSLVQRALKDAQNLKVGMARKDIEAHNFIAAGGMIVRSPTRYVYKDCYYINLEIEFDLDASVSQEFSAKDKIKGVSKLAIDHPVMD